MKFSPNKQRDSTPDLVEEFNKGLEVQEDHGPDDRVHYDQPEPGAPGVKTPFPSDFRRKRGRSRG